MAIRPARDEDAEAVAELLAQCGLPGAGLREQFPGGYAVAEAGGCVAGSAGVEVYSDAGLLRSVAIAPELRGAGAGRALVEDRLRWAAGRGLREVYLLTTTATAYFPRFGFETADRSSAPTEVAASREFAGACPASAVLMRRPVSRPY